jgi:hypothetical protein
MWLAFIGAPVFLAVAAYQYYDTLKLEKQGVQVVGTVVDSHPWRTVKGRTSYRITVDYLPKDYPLHRKQFIVPESVCDWRRLALVRCAGLALSEEARNQSASLRPRRGLTNRSSCQAARRVAGRERLRNSAVSGTQLAPVVSFLV